MRKSVKISLYVLISLAVLCVIAVLIMPFIFDPNEYKFELTEAVRKSTGRVMNIEGDLKLQVLPKLAITAGKVSLNNPEGFDQSVFAEFESGFFRIRFVPLLSRKIDIKKIVLNGLKIHLVRTRDGRMNWKRFRAVSKNSGKHTIPLRYQNLSAGRAVLADSPLAMLFALKLDIFNAEITYEDKLTGIDFKAEDLEILIDRFDLGRQIEFRIQGKLTNSKPQFQEQASIRGRIFVNQELSQFRVEEFVWNSKLEGNFLPDYFKQAQLTTSAEIDFAKNTLTATDLHLTSGQTSIGADISASRIFEKPVLNGQVSIQGADPLKLLEVFGYEYTSKNPGSMQSLNGKFGLQLNESRLLVKDIELNLDGSPIRGVASITGLESPRILFNLSAEMLDVDRYLDESGALPFHYKVPANSRESEAKAPPTRAQEGLTRRLNGTTVKGVLYFESLRLWGMRAEGAQIAFDWSNEVLRANQQIKNLYGGHLKGSVEFNYRGKESTLALNQKLTGVKVGPLLENLSGRKSIDGSLDASISLAAEGNDAKALKSSVDGEIDATLLDGELHLLSFEKVINESKQHIPEKGFAIDSMSGLTQFSKLTFEAKLNNGLMKNSSMNAHSKHFDFTGQGDIDLGDDRVDYRIDAVMRGDPDPIAGLQVRELEGLRIPVQIGGKLGALTIRPEFKEARKDPKIKAALDRLRKNRDAEVPGFVKNLY